MRPRPERSASTRPPCGPAPGVGGKKTPPLAAALAQTQGTHAGRVGDTEQVRPLAKPPRLSFLGPRLQRFSAFHEDPAPTVRRRVPKDAEQFSRTARKLIARI